MIARAYRFADAFRAAGIPVVMGGPHVTELPAEALGRDGGPRHADAVALGEADETWPRIVADAAQGRLKEIYEPVDDAGKERKPSLKPYPVIPWDNIDLDQFNLIPKMFRRFTERHGFGMEIPEYDADRIRPRLPLRLRVLHGNRFLWRLDPFPDQRKRRQRTPDVEASRP